MVKKNNVKFNSVEEINSRVRELKLELSKEKGMLVSKTKTVNSAKKKLLKKEIARLLTQKTVLVNSDVKKVINSKIKNKRV
jgi:large subunit ribosomal protein L29